MNNFIPPGSTLGIIGGGQLGRMLCQAASRLGYRTHVFTPEKESPASQVATETTVAAYDDVAALERFARRVQVVTFEFENIPHASLAALESLVPVRPSARLLMISQNRLREKAFVNEQGIGTTAFAPVYRAEDIPLALRVVGAPAVLKTTEMGYDGKGQEKIELGTDTDRAWRKLNTKEAILEAFVNYEMEISVIVARNAGGEVRTYDPVQNVHTNHILDTTTAPAPISLQLAEEARRIAVKLAEASDLIGLLAVEMFLTGDNKILVNELAPRPHNSGHWTMDACVTGQFEQHVRAVCNLPLGSTDRICDAVMRNLIGAEVEKWRDFLDESAARLHLYGKKEARAGRKMGHVTFLKLHVK